MDEVDKIIIHSLKQIGCKVDAEDGSEVTGLSHFTSDLLVRAVSKCLQEIKADVVVPKTLPENMAQRFTVATSLAEMCGNCGYRGDIGYQTFLYPNVVDIRRLFMFLIEQLPKEQVDILDNSLHADKNDYDLLIRDVRKIILQQLKSPWVPQYCRSIANRKPMACASLSVAFFPQLNLNIPEKATETSSNDERYLVSYQIPSLFQQISLGEFDVVSSVLHKNAIDVYVQKQSFEDVKLSITPLETIFHSPIKSLKDESKQEADKSGIITITPLQKLTDEVEGLKQQNDEIVKERQTASIKLNQMQKKRSEINTQIENVKKKLKIFERTSVILINPSENLSKLEGLIEKIRERRLAVDNQWQLHRNVALQQINELQKVRQSKNIQNINELRLIMQQLETTLRGKSNSYDFLTDELKRASSGLASRKEYTRRIYEFIGNIRKQRNDIYKILDDTKDLQKQINSVSAQLQRQFNYTDDLLFQSAKHDLHAKQAYKLLASLHEACNSIYDLVLHTGQMTKEARDIEVQIDRERMRNVAASLEKITIDIQKFEMIIKTMKSDINQVENEIYTDKS